MRIVQIYQKLRCLSHIDGAEQCTRLVAGDCVRLHYLKPLTRRRLHSHIGNRSTANRSHISFAVLEKAIKHICRTYTIALSSTRCAAPARSTMLMESAMRSFWTNSREGAFDYCVRCPWNFMIAKKHQRRRNEVFAQAIIYLENLSLSCLLCERVRDTRVQQLRYLLQSL